MPREGREAPEARETFDKELFDLHRWYLLHRGISRPSTRPAGAASSSRMMRASRPISRPSAALLTELTRLITFDREPLPAPG
jgi:hypothetical protein